MVDAVTFRPGLRRFLLIIVSLVSACQSDPGSVESKPFSLDSVMKSDLDMLVEIQQRQTFAYLRELTEKLYRRNPRELRKQPGATLDSQLERLFPETPLQPGVDGSPGGIELLGRTFDEQFQGDRVFVLVAGLRDMVMSAYNHKVEFYFLDEPLDPQKFYNCARNVEILLWRLAQEQRANGEPWVVTNALDRQAGPVNISYERLFGKLIGQLDLMALMIADQRNIQIKNLMRSVASAVFLPV